MMLYLNKLKQWVLNTINTKVQVHDYNICINNVVLLILRFKCRDADLREKLQLKCKSAWLRALCVI